MGLLVRLLLAVGGVGAAFLVGRDADNFGVVQGMLALLVAATVLALVGLTGRRSSAVRRAACGPVAGLSHPPSTRRNAPCPGP